MIENTRNTEGYRPDRTPTAPSPRCSRKRWEFGPVGKEKSKSLVERDRDILNLINWFGRVDSVFIRRLCFDSELGDSSKVQLRRSIKRLKEYGLIEDSTWINGLKIYAIKHSRVIKRELGKLEIFYYGRRSFSPMQMDHDLLVCRAFEWWNREFGSSLPFFLTERMIKKTKYKFESSMPDLVFSGTENFEKVYIVEVETTLKETHRYKKKILDYLDLGGVQNIVFYCSNKNIEKRIKEASKVIDNTFELVKVRSIEVFNER